VGHAIEHSAKPLLYHGEAIAIGMCVTAQIAFELGLCGPEAVAAHFALFEKYDLPTRVPGNFSVEDIIGVLHHDKHCVGVPHMLLLEAVGKPAVTCGRSACPVQWEVVERALRKNQQGIGGVNGH
jgi:3-dehydroquinate synthase